MADSGLSSQEAAARLAVDGPNELPEAERNTLLAVAADVLREPMLLLLIATGAVYFLLGDHEEAVAMMAAIGVVVGISLYQTHKTERALQALRDLSSPRALVIRDGVHMRIPGRDVVRGDELVLQEGDRVPADATLESSSNLSVDESLLTGESVPVAKSCRDSGLGIRDSDRRIYSGTLIVRGTGLARVFATGALTELGKIGASLARLDVDRTSLQREVSQLVQLLAAAGLSVCAALAIVYGFTRDAWLDGILAGLTVAIAMVPEEFPVVLTVFLALGAWRISRSRVLTRRIPAIETLGAATVLCVDKTGTLTLNRMSVSAISVDGVLTLVAPNDTTLAATAVPVIEAAILASRKDPFDPMERAFGELGGRLALDVPRDGARLLREYPLSDTLLAVTHVWEYPAQAARVVATKGAPEAIARLCRLDDGTRRVLLEHVSGMASRGLRVLGVARATCPSADLPDSPDPFDFSLVGLVGLSDPVRPGVPAAIDECRHAGIRVMMITGDHADTAMAIAREIGLANPDACLTGAEVGLLEEAKLLDRIASVNVFARMAPEQKLRLVAALKAQGEVVAMTGDGVNDAPALKAAHIGIAMGERGTDVAREAAALVLMDDDFSSIVRAVRLGRRIYDNIAKAMSYVLGIHVPIALVSMVPVVLGGPMVLLPLHIILMELIIDPACSVAFEMEPEEADLMRRPPRNPRQRLFTRRLVSRSILQGAGAGVVTLIVYLAAILSGLDEFDVRTLTFATLIVANLALIVSSRSLTRSAILDWGTRNAGLWLLAGGALTVLAAVFYVPFLRDLFRLAMPHPGDLTVVVAAGFAALVWMELVKHLTVPPSPRS